MNPLYPRSTIVATPWNKPEKLRNEKKMITKRIRRETIDLSKLVRRHNPLQRLQIFSFYESTMTRLRSSLYKIRNQYEHHCQVLKITQTKFRKYVLFDDPKETEEEIPQTQARQVSEEPATAPEQQAEKRSFTDPRSAPFHTVLAMQDHESQKAAGEAWAEANFPPEAPEEDIKLTSKPTEETDPRFYQETTLTNVSLFDVVLTNAVVCAGMLLEYFVYSSVLSALFGMEGSKAAFSGAAVILLAKVIGVKLQGSVRRFFKHQSRIFRVRQYLVNWVFLSVCITGIIYCVLIGWMFSGHQFEKKLAREYVMVNDAGNALRDELEVEGIDREETLQKLKENNERLEEIRTKLSADEMNVFHAFVFAFCGVAVLIFSSVLFAVAMVYGTSYSLRRKTERTAHKISSLKAKFDSQKNLIRTFRTKSRRIFALHGEVRFLQHLLDGGVPADVLYDPFKKEEEVKSPLPLANGTMVSHNS